MIDRIFFFSYYSYIRMIHYNNYNVLYKWKRDIDLILFIIKNILFLTINDTKKERKKKIYIFLIRQVSININ